MSRVKRMTSSTVAERSAHVEFHGKISSCWKNAREREKRTMMFGLIIYSIYLMSMI